MKYKLRYQIFPQKNVYYIDINDKSPSEISERLFEAVRKGPTLWVVVKCGESAKALIHNNNEKIAISTNLKKY